MRGDLITEYLCEGCLGLTPLRRIRCHFCNKLFCKYHINNHGCEKKSGL